MALPVEELAYKPIAATGSVKRRLDERVAEVCLSVKDFGAVGDGAADDTLKVQACFDAAFGAYAAPHGNEGSSPGPTHNYSVYFPPGIYKVASTVSRTVTNTTNSGGQIVVTVNSSITGSILNDDIVYVQGVLGTTNANGAWGVTVLTSTTLLLRSSSFNSAFAASSGTLTMPALRLRAVQGGRIFGAGRFESVILNSQAGTMALSLNGFAYSTIEDLSIRATGTEGVALDVNWNQTGAAFEIATQSNTFSKLWLAGHGRACQVGLGQAMCSESLFFNCFLSCGGATPTGIGLLVGNQNALSQTIIGGNIAQCGYGIRVTGGSCPVIHGVAFQNYTEFGGTPTCNPGYDISIESSSNDAYAITGCRTESHENFIQCLPDPVCVAIVACNATTPSVAGFGFFYKGGAGAVKIDSCRIEAGFYISPSHGSIIIDNTTFPDTAYLTEGSTGPAPTSYRYLQISPQPTRTITNTTYSLHDYECGHKLLFNNASDQTITIPAIATLNLTAGSWFDLQRIGAGKVTFAAAGGVTLRSRNSLLALGATGTAGQYAVGKLVCDANDVWTLSGDLA